MRSAVGCVYTAELRNGKEVFARPGPESGAVTHHPLRNPTGQACRDAVGEMVFGWLEARRVGGFGQPPVREPFRQLGGMPYVARSGGYRVVTEWS